MPPKKTARPRDFGFEQTDNAMSLTSWAQVGPINQKNYYTEYLKRDEQILALRLQNEANRDKMVRAARDKDRALAQSARAGDTPMDTGGDVDQGQDGAEGPSETETLESKTIVIHPGSMNLRIGLATDVLPKAVPMVIARKSIESESEDTASEPLPKRRKLDDASSVEPGKLFDAEFIEDYAAMTTDLKARLRRKAIRSVPTAREQAVIFNKRTPYEEIPEHNDLGQVEWTEIPTDESQAPDHVTGWAALRIPDLSKPRYRLTWPLRNGAFNERDYSSENQLMRDFTIIIEETIKKELGIQRKSDLSQYGCVFVVPDLHERAYVTRVLDMLFRDFGFSRVCFIQESLSASFGAGYSTCVIVDIGAQKTSISCVDEGLCIENSRLNLRYGGEDITETFMKMMLIDSFPYSEINLRRRPDFLLAEELKQKCCTFDWSALEKGSIMHEFELRVFGQDTRRYRFKTFDEVMLAPLGLFAPGIFDHTDKLRSRRKLIGRSYDMYDGTPNDPMSSAQATMLALNAENEDSSQQNKDEAGANEMNGVQPSAAQRKIADATGISEPRAGQSASATPAQEDGEGAQAARASTPQGAEKDTATKEAQGLEESIKAAELQDRTLPVLPLVEAINLAIQEGAGSDERKQRDFYGGILCTGGGVLIPEFYRFLEEELLASQPKFKKEIIVSPPPRDIDPQVATWKGASVFGKLHSSNDTWISKLEYSMLNNRILMYKCLWAW